MNGSARGSSENIHLGLGSNLGDRECTLNAAISSLGDVLDIVVISPWYETSPVGMLDQPEFLNLVLEARTGLTPRRVLDLALTVERSLGRRRDRAGERHLEKPNDQRYGPRIIDVDLLLYGRSVVDEPGVQVPHPRLHERAFVLVPLSDIAPMVVHPTLGRSVAQLLADLSDESRRGVRLFRGSHRAAG